jgi:hypothetical protein
MSLGLRTAPALSESYVLRFSDTPVLHQSSSHGQQAFAFTPVAQSESPTAPAQAWLEQHLWKQVWPPWSASVQALSFAGPPAQRYLRIATENSYYIWTRELDIDPHQLPFLEITWGIEQFPQEAALDIYGRNDRPLALMLSFGPKVSSPGLRPNVPRTLAFFWGETETIGVSYTCVTPRLGPADKRLQCIYPHVKYIALRRGETHTVYTDRVPLLEVFQQHFPAYWQEHQRVPPIVGVSLEAGSNKTNSASSARLYALVFTAQAAAFGTNGQRVLPPHKGQ